MEHRVQADNSTPVAYAPQGKNKGRDMISVQCFHCKAYGHFPQECPKKSYNYCKKSGHLIAVCPTRLEKKKNTIYHTSTGKQKISTQPWYFDSSASNHLTNNVVSLSNVRKYDGDLHINITDGSSLSISVVGDLSSSLADVFVSPDLSTNLLSIGQLVDEDCNV
ncbi:uncharacterized protein [Aristolochia californica]|uniref:uncharacterized protein n=1 Tax=Aristolochia californica TaxID=171875 RepID=UPI0035DBEC2D